MDPVNGGFRDDYLSELRIAHGQLLALAEAIPESLYSWKPDADGRSFARILTHVAGANLMLLSMAGSRDAAATYGIADDCEDGMARALAMIRRNVELEKIVEAKTAVLDLLRRSFDLVSRHVACIDFDAPAVFFGQNTTAGRILLRLLVHTHEHMGQAVAYARSAGVPVPWPDPLKYAGISGAGAA